MEILKHVHYVYIFFTVVFLYDGFERIYKSQPHPWLSFAIAAAALFMFFFRRKFSKKFQDRYNNRKP